jgi:antibiotic biosynthesis monooxygenase (ABM) superfamily enzyme
MNGVHTLVVAGKIKRGRASDYERWVSKLVTALQDTPGYDGMTAIWSPDPQGSVGTLLIRFCSAEKIFLSGKTPPCGAA